MKFTETPYFILKEYFTDDYKSIDYTAFPNTDYYKSITWENILFSSRLFDGYSVSGLSITLSGSINSIDYYTEDMILSAGTSGGVYFYDRRDTVDRERIKFNMSSYASEEGNVYIPSTSGTGMIVGATNGIVVRGGGGIEDLYIKNRGDDDLPLDKQKGFLPLKFTFIDIQDENYIRISVHNSYDEFPGTTSNIMEGSNVSGGYFIDYDTVKYNNIIVGREVYFRKDSMFHDWIIRFAQEVILKKYGITIDTRGYVNTDTLFIYLGKIYESSTDELGINYIIEYYGLKDYILSIVPPHQRTPNLKEFINIAFDRLYHNVYTRQKDGYTLYDPSEIDIKYLGYIAKYYGFPDLQPIVIEEGIYREFVSNIIHLLKRKGTFADLYTIWGATTQTNNHLNVYERWIPSGNPSITDTTRVVQEDEWVDIIYTSKPEYDVTVPTDGAGVGWYSDYDSIDIYNLSVCNIANTTANFPEYPTDRYELDDMILSSNYRIELDINSEPLSIDSILSKATFDGLYDSFETIRPVYRSCRYSIVFAPLVDLTGNSVDLYGSTNFIGEKYDNTYVHSRSFISDYTHTNSYIGLQCVSSTEWIFYLEFNTPDIVVQCYDLNFNLITPLNTVITSAGDNLLLTFDTEQTGYAVVKKTNKTSINEIVYDNQIIPIEHSLYRTDILVQVYYIDPTTYNQILLDIDYIEIIDNNNIEIDVGVGNLNIGDISAHISTNEVPIVRMFETTGVDNTCIIDHDLGSRFVLLSVYDNNDMSLYPDIELLSITSSKLTFTEPTTGYVSVLHIGSYNILQELIGFDENNIQTSPTYNVYDADQNILETGIISEFKQDLNYNYINWNLDYSSEYNNISTIEILNNEDVKFRTVISDLYKPPEVDFYMHYRVLKTATGHIIEWNDNYYTGNETANTLPTNQCGAESTIAISTNIHPSILTWSIESSDDDIVFSSTGTTSYTGYDPEYNEYFTDPENKDLHVVTVNISCSGIGNESATIKVGAGSGVYNEKTITTVYEGMSFISFDPYKSDRTIYPYETSEIILKTDGTIDEIDWNIRPDDYIFVGDPIYYNGGATRVVSAGGLARENCVVSVSGCVFSDTWAIENTFKESFETTWDISEDDKTITLPLPSTGTYDFEVNWGDGTISEVTSYNDENITHTYIFSGTKHVSITGVMTAWAFDGVGDCLKLISVDSGGQTELDDLSGAFNGCINLISIPNTTWTTYVTNMDYMFYGCTSFNIPLDKLDTSSCLSMSNMFYNATLFNQSLGSWDISNVTDMTDMLVNTSLSIANYDNLLIGWAKLQVQTDVIFSVGTTQYSSDAEDAHYYLDVTKAWDITDGGIIT